MCNLYRNDPKLADWAREFEEMLGLKLLLEAGDATLANQPWKEMVYPKYAGLFMRPADLTDPTATVEPAVGRWGLVPFYHKGPAKDFKLSTNNARSETMATSGTFKFSLKERRCIIPATAIYEYSGPKGSMTKHAISRADGRPLFLARLWSFHSWEADVTESYTMVMQDTRPGDDMHVFHNRQPVFLDAAGARTWLDTGADYAPLLTGPPPGTLVADPPQPAAS
jgi:putative SOS response-associated peptidase YedK